jgi:FkbM family methyltransferase
MRRAGLAIHGQIDSLRENVQAIAEENTRLRNSLSGLGAEHSQAAAFARELLPLIRDHVLTIADATSQIHDSARRTESTLPALSNHLYALAAATQDTADLIARRPPSGLPVDATFLDSKTEAEIIAVAESLAALRPLVPYPKWRSDADLQNPDLAFQLRRWIWEYFNQRRREAAIIVPWHGDCRLRLYLGADLSRQVYIAGCFEPNEFALLDRFLQPGMTFVDAGANDGLYTVFAARRVGDTGEVWAFEPSARELERLKHNLELNQAAARVFPIALADVPGTAELVIGDSEHSGQNTLGAFAYAVQTVRNETVEVRRLDDLIAESPLSRVDVLKIDIEGAEFRMLTGALSTLRRHRPMILFEMSEDSLRHQGSSRAQVLDLLRSESYLILAFEPNTGLPVPAADGVFTDNMIAFPKERDIPDALHWPWPRQ